MVLFLFLQAVCAQKLNPKHTESLNEPDFSSANNMTQKHLFIILWLLHLFLKNVKIKLQIDVQVVGNS